MLHLLQSIYQNAKSRVYANNSFSEPFLQSKGVRQGCNLSPLLFSLYMNDLQSYLNCNLSGSCKLNNHKIRLLMFADDIVLLTDSAEGLQNSINRLVEFCNGWDLSINIEKTKVLIFNKPTCSTQFVIYDSPLEQVREYKYLGIMLSEKSIFKSTSKLLANQANKALFSLMKTLSNLSYPKPSLMCYLFDLLVRPVLNYASEIWNFTVSEYNDSPEIVHCRFCKFVLGVNTNAPNLAVYGELGRTPLSIHRKILSVKYWCRLVTDDDLPAYLREAYILAKKKNLKWYNSIVNIMKSTGLDQMCNHLTVHPNILINDLKQRLINLFMEDWTNQLQLTTGKLRTYKNIKYDFIYEPYLELPFHLRNSLTKLRISNHSLRIETGRFNIPPLPAEDRKCFICDDAVEDELHFLFDCDCYHDLDEHKDMLLYFGYLNNSFEDLPNIDKWHFISNTRDTQANYILSRFIVKGFQLRSTLLNSLQE